MCVAERARESPSRGLSQINQSPHEKFKKSPFSFVSCAERARREISSVYVCVCRREKALFRVLEQKCPPFVRQLSFVCELCVLRVREWKIFLSSGTFLSVFSSQKGKKNKDRQGIVLQKGQTEISKINLSSSVN